MIPIRIFFMRSKKLFSAVERGKDLMIKAANNAPEMDLCLNPHQVFEDH